VTAGDVAVRRLAILGSTGSIGRSALAVVDAHADRLRVVALAAGENAAQLAEQITRYRPAVATVATEAALADLRTRGVAGAGTALHAGPAGLIAAATHPDVDVVLCATSGTTGLEAVLAAIAAGKTIALANKEVLVMAGALVTEAARARGVALLPVDSEHNAIHQCLHGRDLREVKRLVLTASGGPFRGLDNDALAQVTPDDALRHPTWQMGRKITVDSATLMNKGLEVIEAHWLFDVAADQIEVVVHPQSIVHSMVEFCDGSVIAQLGVTDMRLPIQYAFSYPARWSGALPALDLTRTPPLEFLPTDARFRCLPLAYEALRRGGAWPVVLNAANEIAVGAFLDRQLSFPNIARVIEDGLTRADRHAAPRSLEEIREIDLSARRAAAETIRTLRSS
jgi:1-deoxy-D-xylulose-5-phosphate reductoisomerase